MQEQSNVACEDVVRPILEAARDAALWRYHQLVERPAHLQPMINRCNDSLRRVRTPPAGTDWRTDVAELRDWNEATRAALVDLKELWLVLDRAGHAPCPAVAITACSRPCSEDGLPSACSQVTRQDDLGRDVSETQIDYFCARDGSCRDSVGAPTPLALTLAHEAAHALLTSGDAPDNEEKQHKIMGWLTCLTGDAGLQEVSPAFCDEFLDDPNLGVLERHCVSCSPTCSDGSRR